MPIETTRYNGQLALANKGSLKNNVKQMQVPQSPHLYVANPLHMGDCVYSWWSTENNHGWFKHSLFPKKMD